MGSGLSGDEGVHLTRSFSSELRLGPFSLETIWWSFRRGRVTTPWVRSVKLSRLEVRGPRPWLCPHCPASKLSSCHWWICQHGQRRLKQIKRDKSNGTWWKRRRPPAG